MDTIANALIWILIIEIFSFSTFPALSLLFKGIGDRGFALSKILGILIASYIVWIFGSLHIFEFSRTLTVVVSFLVIVIFLLISIAHIKIRERILNRMIQNKLENKEADQYSKEERVIESIVNKEAATTEKTNLRSKIQNSKHYKKLEQKYLSSEMFTPIEELKHVNKIIIIEEIIFILIFFFWVYMRGINPNIMGTEKFMDFGIMNALLKSQYFPPHDMWLSGFNLNYYYYGQYIFTFLTRLSGLGANFTYNFSISTIFALTVILAISIVHSLTKKIIPALIAGFVTGFAGNLNFILTWLQYLFIHHNLSNFSFWYPTSTRLIPFTINEYPIYSFVVADLHAHVTDIPMVLGSIIISLNIFIKKKFGIIDLLLSGFILGIIAVTNSWDAIFYASILFIVIMYLHLIKEHDKEAISGLSLKGKLIYFKNKIADVEYQTIIDFFNIPFFEGIVTTFLTGLFGIILFIPFYLTFKAPVDGIGINTMAHSDPTLVLVLFGFFLFFIISFIGFLLYSLISKKKFADKDIFVVYLVVLGLGLVIIPEIFFLKDIFYKVNPTYFRANTVFKLYYQAWILFSIAVGYIIARINGVFRLKDVKPFTKPLIGLWDLVVVIFLIGVFSYTYIILNQGYLNIMTQASNPETCKMAVCTASFKTDDGTDYIRTDHPDDYAMITWLNKYAAPNSVIAEAVGDSYTYYARISVNTGLATVLGWPNHEFQWRNTYAYSDQRTTDVFNLYNSGTIKQIKNIIQKYNISYIIVGEQERLKYSAMNEPLLKDAGVIVFQSGSSYIIQAEK